MAAALTSQYLRPLPTVLPRRSAPSRRPQEMLQGYAPLAETSSLYERPAERKPPARVVLDVQALLLIEGEDAKITGGTRSLMRRVLALNLRGTLPLSGS